jgi:parallel beta-helix repeat protein
MKRKTVTLALISTLIFSFCGILVQPVEAQSFESIYIRADGSVEGTDKIQREGDFYTLISDINGSIVVERENIVFNGASYILQGDENANGITLDDIRNTTVKNLTLSSFNIGIVVMGSNNNKILEITITDSFRGLDLTASENNTVSGNYIANNNDGIALENMYNNIVENVITNNSDIGIFLNGAGYNNILGNNITNNKRGIVVSICYDNVVYHNNFVNNVNHVETDNSDGIWDNGEEGNYWADYAGLDSDEHGIGDTPYVIDENNRDNYPLMKPITISKTESFPSLWVVAVSVVVIVSIAIGILVYFKKRKKQSGINHG